VRRGALCSDPPPHPVEWLSENGSIFAAHKIIEIALALNLAPCFTSVESPKSNGMAAAFVKTFKRNYVRISPIPDVATELAAIDHWMEDSNTVHPHSRLGYRLPGNTSYSNPPRVRFDGVNSTSRICGTFSNFSIMEYRAKR
jgi:transposase InsO family protein